MEVTTSQYKHCDVVQARGRVDSQSAPSLGEVFDAIIEAGRFTIVFDMSGVEYLSSAGLRVIIDAQKTCKRWNRGEMVLAGVPKQVYEVLELVGFVPLFRFFDDATAAVGSF
jgi:anti-sigma B factor antagonist